MTEPIERDTQRHRIRRLGGAAMVALVATVLAGCVGIPSGGGVNPGPPVTSGNGDSTIVDLPSGPPPHASKNEIFADFLQAATSSAGNYQIASSFLTSKAAQAWDPTKSVLIREKPSSPKDVGNDNVTYSVSTKASINALGVYSEQSTDSNETLSYSFSRVKGEWRISELPDGVVVSRSTFENSFKAYPVYFFDPDYRYLVPDVRWFPTGSTVPSRIVSALVAGPSGWLQGGVVATSIPAGVTLSSTVVRANAATVDFSADAASTKTLARARMRQQLAYSLAAAAITNVTMSAHGAPIAVANSQLAQQIPAIAVENPPLIQRGKQFGFYPRLESLPVSAKVVSLAGSAAVVDRAQTSAAVLTKAGVWLVKGSVAPRLVDSRKGLIAPSIDPSGYVWSVPSSDASAIIAVGSDGVVHPITSTIPSRSTIVSLDVSHDGTRMLLYLATGAGPRLIVAGIVRQDGVPASLGQQLLDLPVSAAQPIDATWVDASTVAALGQADGSDTVTSYVIGGPPGEASTTEGAVHIVGAAEADSLRLITADGQVQQLRASGWQDTIANVSLLATQQ